MPEALQSTNDPDEWNDETSPDSGLSVLGIFRAILSPFTRLLVDIAGWIRVHRFRRDVISQMSLTIGTLHPNVIIGGIEKREWYAEICLDFGDFRLRLRERSTIRAARTCGPILAPCAIRPLSSGWILSWPRFDDWKQLAKSQPCRKVLTPWPRSMPWSGQCITRFGTIYRRRDMLRQKEWFNN